MALRALARVTLAAIERNVVSLRDRLDGDAPLCAVVKADASGHGAVPVARAALAGGATTLAVATGGEAAQLRAAGLTAAILIMGAVSSEELPVALAAGAELVAWDERFVAQLAVAPRGDRSAVALHVERDSGMGRLGTRDTAEAFATAEAIRAAAPALRLAGVMTHLA